MILPRGVFGFRKCHVDGLLAATSVSINDHERASSESNVDSVQNNMQNKTAAYQRLLNYKITVVNMGLEGFVTDPQHARANVVHVDVDWTPPAGGDPAFTALLAK